MRFVIEGKPIAKKSLGIFRKGRMVGAYNPNSKDLKIVRELIIIQMNNALNSTERKVAIEASSLATGESFHVKLWYGLPSPKSWPESKRNASYWRLSLCNTKPDLDNMQKFYGDCLKGIVFYDDAQVSFATHGKFRSQTPKIIIEVTVENPVSLNPKAEWVLKCISPQDLTQFLSIAQEISKVHEGETFEDLGKDQGAYQQRLEQTAALLSQISVYGETLTKIYKKCGFLDGEIPVKKRSALCSHDYYPEDE